MSKQLAFNNFLAGFTLNFPRQCDGDREHEMYRRGKVLADELREGLESNDEVYLAGVSRGLSGAPRSGVELYNRGLDYGKKCWGRFEEEVIKWEKEDETSV